MKPVHRHCLLLAAMAVLSVGCFYWPVEPTILSFRIGQTFEEVAKGSTFPVLKNSNLPSDDPVTRFGVTWVTERAVTIRFNDPEHGFTLPPTKFAALSYLNNRAETLATSPMLQQLAFEEAVQVLAQVQNQLKASGWEPWDVDGSRWFDLSADGKRQLYQRLFAPDHMITASLRVPGKYGMTFRLWCSDGCETKRGPYRFLIDIGIGPDTYSWKPE
jgi:hypothetical protein